MINTVHDPNTETLTQKPCDVVVQAIAEMGMIKVQGDREQAMSEAEWKQLSNLIENDRRERVCPLSQTIPSLCHYNYNSSTVLLPCLDRAYIAYLLALMCLLSLTTPDCMAVTTTAPLCCCLVLT